MANNNSGRDKNEKDLVCSFCGKHQDEVERMIIGPGVNICSECIGLCADLLSNIASEQRAKVVYEYLYRQIDDKKVRETIDFLLNREEAHNALFREAFNKVQDTGSNRDFGVTKDSRIYFDLSGPSPSGAFGDTKADPPSFNNPNA